MFQRMLLFKSPLSHTLSAIVVIVSFIIDYITGLADCIIMTFTLGLTVAFVYYGYKAFKGKVSHDFDVIVKALNYSLLVSLFFGGLAFWYLIEPFEIVDTGRYRYHSWTFGSFCLSVSLFCLYLRCLMSYKLKNTE